MLTGLTKVQSHFCALWEENISNRDKHKGRSNRRKVVMHHYATSRGVEHPVSPPSALRLKVVEVLPTEQGAATPDRRAGGQFAATGPLRTEVQSVFDSRHQRHPEHALAARSRARGGRFSRLASLAVTIRNRPSYFALASADAVGCPSFLLQPTRCFLDSTRSQHSR